MDLSEQIYVYILKVKIINFDEGERQIEASNGRKLILSNEIFIDDKKMIGTSFPNFKEVFNSIGADIVNVSK